MTRRVGAALLSALILWGCATQHQALDPADSGFFGTFRGRWWNYYDRGVLYLDAGRYAEAESDFRVALRGRSRDAWSARTYGLHFTEYFPNRELGILYYHLDQLDDAKAALEKSLENVDSARAHHYLGLVERARIAKGLLIDTDAPALSAQAASGLAATSFDVPLVIAARDDTGLAEVSLDGVSLYKRGYPAEAQFTDTTLRLDEGVHTFQVHATDLADKTTEETLVVRVDVTAPTVAVFEPAPELVTQPGTMRLRGACADAFGLGEVRLGDQLLADGGGTATRLDFEAEITVQPGDNLWVLQVFDAAGNENRAAVRVYGGNPASADARMWWLQHRAPERLQLAGSLDAFVAALASAYTALDEPIAIDLQFPESTAPEEVYRRNALSIRGRILSQTEVASLVIQDRTIPILNDPQGGGGETAQTFQTKVALDRGDNDIPVSARDAAGNAAEERIRVQADFVITDTPESKMPLAVLSFLEERSDGEYKPVLSLQFALEEQLGNQGRFFIVDRAQLENILLEQQLSAALGDRNAALQLGQVVSAQAFVIGLVTPRVDNGREGADIRLRIISTETTQVIGNVDTFITDRNDAEALLKGIEELAELLRQKYPRLTGRLLDFRGDMVITDYTAEDGVFPGMYLLILKEVEPWIDTNTGIALSEGSVEIVDRVAITKVDRISAQGKRISGEEPVEKDMPTITW